MRSVLAVFLTGRSLLGAWTIEQKLGVCVPVPDATGNATLYRKLDCRGDTLASTLYADDGCTQKTR